MPDPETLSVAEMRAIIGDKATDTILEHWRRSKLPSPAEIEGALRWLNGSRKSQDVEATQRLAATWLETSRSRRSFLAWLENQKAQHGDQPVAELADDDETVITEPEPEHKPMTHDTSGGIGWREGREGRGMSGVMPPV